MGREICNVQSIRSVASDEIAPETSPSKMLEVVRFEEQHKTACLTSGTENDWMFLRRLMILLPNRQNLVCNL